MAFASVAAVVLGLASWHAPHDSVYSLAAVTLGPQEELLVAVWSDQKLRLSRDDGRTWEILPESGLNNRAAWEVAYHPGLPAAGGRGLVLVAAQNGLWALDPVTRETDALEFGMQPGDKFVIDLAVPRSGNGPAMLLTETGSVYLLDPTTMVWTKRHDTGSVVERRGDVAMSPYFDAQSSLTGAHDLHVAANGRLWTSDDLGSTWTLSPAFPTTATSVSDWMITSIALSEDYLQDQTLVLGRVRITAGQSEQGQIWQSDDRAATATLAHSVATGIYAVAATSPGPSGLRSFFAAGRAFPNVGIYQGVGVLRSQDGGITWDDNGSFQDFLLEDFPGNKSGNPQIAWEQCLVELPNYEERGEIWYTRLEGMFPSKDEGLHWTQKSSYSPFRIRDIATVIGPSGETLVFAANYGAGTLMHDRTAGTTTIVDDRCPLVFQTHVAISPRFAEDGRLLATGSIGLLGWQHPTVGVPPPAGTGWYEPPVEDPLSGESLRGYPAKIAYSPNYDGLGRPGTDGTFFWVTRDGLVLRSDDHGETATELPLLTTGLLAPQFSTIAIAPTFPQNGSDVYAVTAAGKLYRLETGGWEFVVSTGTSFVEGIAFPSDWSRPANPTLYIALQRAPYCVQVLDNPGAPVVTDMDYGLTGLQVTSIALHPDFGATPQVFLSTVADGVHGIDLAIQPLEWEQLGTGFPRYRCNDVELSKDFANDGLVFVGTDYGLYESDSTGARDWRPVTSRTRRDDTDEQISTYAPLHATNTQPDHIYPWLKRWRGSVPGDPPVLGDLVLVATSDQSQIRTPASGRQIRVLTYRAQTLGVMTVSAFDTETGALLATVSADLDNGAWPPATYEVVLDVPATPNGFELVIDAQLDPGEFLPFDGLEFRL